MCACSKCGGGIDVHVCVCLTVAGWGCRGAGWKPGVCVGLDHVVGVCLWGYLAVPSGKQKGLEISSSSFQVDWGLREDSQPWAWSVGQGC